MLIYTVVATVAVIVLSIFLVASNNDNKTLEMSLQNIAPEITTVVITPEPTEYQTAETKEELAPSSTPNPVATIYPTIAPDEDYAPRPTPTEYIPTDEDIAFKNMIIEEGRTFKLEIVLSEWDLINILCNKLRKDEYFYRLQEFDDEPGKYFLIKSREIFEAANTIVHGIDLQSGNIFYEEMDIVYIGNILTMGNIGEPFRTPEDEELIDNFVKRILKLEKAPDDIDIFVMYTQSGFMYIETINKTDPSIWVEYWVDRGTWEVWDEDYDVFYGTLFD